MEERLRLLLAKAAPMPIGPGTPREEHRREIEAVAGSLPSAAQAGLWLRFDFLHESHEISQDDPSREGSFWHAIMHRREPDADNAKYWWRRVGKHPVLPFLAEQSLALGYRYTTAEDFVDFCERVPKTGNPDEGLAVRIQELEWWLLFDWCRADRDPKQSSVDTQI